MFKFTQVIVLILLNNCLKSSAHLGSAISLVEDSEKNTRSESGCQTWIFAIATEEQYCSSYLDIDYLSSSNFLNTHEQELKTKTCAIFCMSNASQYQNLILDREHTSEDIFNSLYFGVSKFVPNCQVVFIYANSVVNFNGVTKQLISNKLLRAHKDYVLLVGKSDAVTEFFNSPLAEDFRYKYSVKFTNHSTIEVADFCNPNSGPKLALFTRNCNSILNGKHIRISAVLGTPYIRFQNNEDGSLHWGVGIQFQLIEHSSQKFNYTFQIIPSNSKGSSGFKRDGKWYGAMGDVFLRRAEIAIAAGITPQRDTVVDNGVPFEWNPRIFFVRSPPLKTNWRAIFWPFDEFVWMLILAMAVVFVPSYFLAIWQYRLHQVGLISGRNYSILGEVVGSIIGIILEQSRNGRRWIGLRIRFLIILWMMFCLVMGAGYRSRLINFLTFIVPDKVPETHAELIDKEYTLFFRFYGGIAYHYTTTSTEPAMKIIAERAILVNSSQECIVLATLTENSACLDWQTHGSFAVFTNATPHVRQTDDIIVKSKESVQTILMAWTYRKMSPLAETFDRFILQTYSSGLFNFWQATDWTSSKADGARWMNSANDSKTKNMLAFFKEFSTNPKPLAISSFYGLFALWAICLLLSTLIWILEFVKCSDSNLVSKLQNKCYMRNALHMQNNEVKLV